MNAPSLDWCLVLCKHQFRFQKITSLCSYRSRTEQPAPCKKVRVKRQSGFKLVWQILFSASALVFLLVVCYLFLFFFPEVFVFNILIIQHATCFKINGLLIFTLTSPSHKKQVIWKSHKLKWYLGSFPILPTFLQMPPHSWPHLQKKSSFYGSK